MKFVFTSIVCLLLVTESVGQDCPVLSENKKALEVYKKGLDRKKYDKGKRMEYLRDAVGLDPNFLEARFELASQIIKTCKYNNSSYSPAVEHYLKVVELCPGFHSDPYFYLGQYYLSDKKYKEAILYLKKFMDFESEEEDKFSNDWEKNIDQSKQDLAYAEFYHEVYGNPVPFDPVKVGNVSSPADEYLPLISPDNENLYFTQRRKKEEEQTKSGVKIRDDVFETDKIQFIERFVAAQNKGDNSFTSGDNLPEPFNMDDRSNYGGATISIDNKHLYLTICQPAVVAGRAYTNCDIYHSHYTLGYDTITGKEKWGWSTLENLGENVNGKDSWEGQPSISADGKTLFFASARKESKGIDIYYSQMDENGQWQYAKNLGAPINTEYNDKSPFIHSDSKTLYFASNGHLGFGGFDVFFAKGNQDGTWNQPRNIGYPINTPEDEHGFVVSTDGSRVYFGSDMNKSDGGGLDLYSFELYKEARPEKVMFLKGEVKDTDGSLPEDAVVELKNAKTNEVTEFKVDPNDGAYAAVVTIKEDEPIVMNVKAKGKAFSSQLIKPNSDKKLVVKVETKLSNIELGKPYQLNDIYYGSNSAELDSKSEFVLKEFILYLKDNPSIKISIQGHTDNVGDAGANLALSSERAFAVLDYLQEGGIAPNRLSFKGYGETKPVASNDSENGRSLNRRTEFVLLSK